MSQQQPQASLLPVAYTHTGGPLYAETHWMSCIHWPLALTMCAKACVMLNQLKEVDLYSTSVLKALK